MENDRSALIDPYDRYLNYLRISITDRCNLQCLYCMPLGGAQKLPHEEILTYEEILRLAGIAISLGVTKIRLTGGEPLARKGFCGFIPHLTSLVGLSDVSLTTNGFFLNEKLEKIRAGGIKRLNISLDSLKRSRYRKITGYDGLKQTLKGIERARKMGFHPIKINMVVMEGVNDDEVLEFAELSLRYPYHVRFIEYMPVGVPDGPAPFRHIPNSLIKAKLGQLGNLIKISKAYYDGPAERYTFKDAPGEVGFISPLSHAFCQSCNRLRLTASGHLRSCLLSDDEEDLKGPMRAGATDQDLSLLFMKATFNKPRAHRKATESALPFNGQMSSIGG